MKGLSKNLASVTLTALFMVILDHYFAGKAYTLSSIGLTWLACLVAGILVTAFENWRA